MHVRKLPSGGATGPGETVNDELCMEEVMTDDDLPRPDDLQAHRCSDHDGCYELYVKGGRYHFRPAEVDELNARFIAALDARP